MSEFAINPDAPFPLRTRFTPLTYRAIDVACREAGMGIGTGPRMALRWYLSGMARPEALPCMCHPYDPTDRPDKPVTPSPYDLTFLLTEQDWENGRTFAMKNELESVSDVVRMGVSSWLGAVAQREVCALEVFDDLERKTFHERC